MRLPAIGKFRRRLGVDLQGLLGDLENPMLDKAGFGIKHLGFHVSNFGFYKDEHGFQKINIGFGGFKQLAPLASSFFETRTRLR